MESLCKTSARQDKVKGQTSAARLLRMAEPQGLKCHSQPHSHALAVSGCRHASSAEAASLEPDAQAASDEKSAEAQGWPASLRPGPQFITTPEGCVLTQDSHGLALTLKPLKPSTDGVVQAVRHFVGAGLQSGLDSLPPERFLEFGMP